MLDASGSTDPDNDIDTYDWTSQSGNIGQTTNHPDADIQYCVNTASQSDTQDTVTIEVTDDEENSDSDSGQIGEICPLDDGPNCGGKDEQACLSSSECTWDGDGITDTATFNQSQDTNCAETYYREPSCPDGYSRADFSTSNFSCIPWDGGIVGGDCQAGDPSPEPGQKNDM